MNKAEIIITVFGKPEINCRCANCARIYNASKHKEICPTCKHEHSYEELNYGVRKCYPKAFGYEPKNKVIDELMAVVGNCLWVEGAMFDGKDYWWRKTCTGEGDTSLWVEAWDGPLPDRCPDCGRKVLVEKNKGGVTPLYHIEEI